MSIKSIAFFLTCLFLLSSVTSPVRACPPPDCGDCKEWDPVQEKCVWKEGAECENSLDCKTCYYCISCQCELPYGSECGEDDPCPGECHTCVGSEVCLCENDDTKCGTCEECVNGVCTSCADLGKACCNDKCVVSTDDCWGIDLTIIYEGSCVCFTPSITCMSDDAELRDLGLGKMATYVRECVKVPNGTCGRTQCDMLGENQLIAKLWTCRDETNMMGVLLCWEINALVCIVRCGAAASACAVNPGSPECSQGLEDCAQCLASEGIDCGCLTVSCFYDEFPLEIWGNSMSAYGPKCGRP